MKITTHARNASLDIARIIAIVAVVMIHCSSVFVSNYETNMREFVLGNIFNGISRPGVPLFLMISGALFLDENKKTTLKTILSKNVKSLAIITIIWSILYAITYCIALPLFKSKPIRVENVLDSILNGHSHMWYLYMIMGLYMITPFLKKFVCKKNKEMVLFFIYISFVVQFLVPLADKLCIQYLDNDFIGAWFEKFHLDFFGGYITYFLVGWYIVHVGISKKILKYNIYFWGALSLAVMLFAVQRTGDYLTVYDNIGPLVFIYSISIFLALNDIKWKLKEKTTQRLATLSNLSFGVYIIHMLVLSVFNEILPYNDHCVLYIVVSFITVTCGSFLCAFILSKIPLLKKLIRA